MAQRAYRLEAVVKLRRDAQEKAASSLRETNARVSVCEAELAVFVRALAALTRPAAADLDERVLERFAALLGDHAFA